MFDPEKVRRKRIDCLKVVCRPNSHCLVRETISGNIKNAMTFIQPVLRQTELVIHCIQFTFSCAIFSFFNSSVVKKDLPSSRQLLISWIYFGRSLPRQAGGCATPTGDRCGDVVVRVMVWRRLSGWSLSGW